MIKINGIATDTVIFDHGTYSTATLKVNPECSIQIVFDFITSKGRCQIIENDSISEPVIFDIKIDFDLDNYEDKISGVLLIDGLKVEFIKHEVININISQNA